jgi:hypothetical protein
MKFKTIIYFRKWDRIMKYFVLTFIYRLAKGWTVRGLNTGGDEIFRTCPDRAWGPPSLLYNGYRGLPRG